MSVLAREYAMSINSQNRSTRAITTSIFDIIKQTKQQEYNLPMMPTYLNRFD